MMFFTLDQFNNRTEELKRRRYDGHQTIAPFTAKEGDMPVDDYYTVAPEKIDGTAFNLNDHFVGRDRYLWAEKEVQVPSAKDGFEVVGLFDFGETGGGYNSGFESLLYVDGNPYQGVDTHHNEVFFDGLEEKSLRLTFLLWTGLEGGGVPREFHHRLKQADFAYLHSATDELYFFAKAITETVRLLPQDSVDRENLIAVLSRALHCINWDEESFYETATTARDTLIAELDRLEKHTQITVNVVGHTHIDVAWLWRLKHTREKAQRSFATVLRLMERYDEYIFLQTQPQLYKYIKEDCPEMYEQIKEKVAQNKWEPDGGMWVEADCNISSGEALVRQFLHGTRFFEREFGTHCSYLWLPDVFGYSWALPQILKLCEIDTFMTTKISWNQYNEIPNDLFRWRGIDGSEILTYFIDTPSEGQDSSTRYSTYNGFVSPHSVLGSWTKFKNKDISKDVLISYGWGDGGGGVTREMLELRRKMDKLPGLPNVKTCKATDFFEKIHKDVEETDRYVHTWDGELYLEYHRGTYTSQAYSKKTNRHLENKLAQIEWLSSIAYVLGGDYAQQELNDSWECVLLHQFHDIIPGSSIHEVYADSRINYGVAEDRADKVKENVLQALTTSEENTFSIYSSNSFGGEELVSIPVSAEGSFTDKNGVALPAQKTANGYDVLVEVKPFGVETVLFVPNKAPETKAFSVVDTTARTIKNPYYEISWTAEGKFDKIFDRKNNRSVLKQGECGNVLEIFEDKPIQYDAWDIDIFYYEKMETVELAKAVEVIENNELKTVLRFTYVYHNSTICQDVIFYAHTARIDFNTHVDWHEANRLLKAAFYTDIRATKATYDIQFGHVERPTHWNTSWDWARFEVCGHKWADFAETGYGVSLLNNCKYGYSIKDNAMKLTLLKSAKYPDYSADMGEHDFTYALYPHMGTVVEGNVIQEATSLNLPAQVVCGANFNEQRQLVVLDTQAVQIDVVKKAEDENCLVIRMHECFGSTVNATISSEFDVTRMVPCNLLERQDGETISANQATMTFKPFEIKTMKWYF